MESELVVRACYFQIDPTGSGATFGAFKDWWMTTGSIQMAFSELSMDDIRVKCQKYLVLLAKEKQVGSLLDYFLLYDWQSVSRNALNKRVFLHILRTWVFPVTEVEGNLVATYFTSPEDGVLYRRFLDWAQPVLGKVDAQPPTARFSNPSSLFSHLETSVARGVDLMAVFGRYDAQLLGYISVEDFASALSDLGLSSVAKPTAISLAERMNAYVDGKVSYRKIVGGLLKGLDTDASDGAALQSLQDLFKVFADNKVDPISLKHAIERKDRSASSKIDGRISSTY